MTTQPATYKQIAFLRNLLRRVIDAEKDVDPSVDRITLERLEAQYEARIPSHTTTTASETISALRARLSYLTAKRACIVAKKAKGLTY